MSSVSINTRSRRPSFTPAHRTVVSEKAKDPDKIPNTQGRRWARTLTSSGPPGEDSDSETQEGLPWTPATWDVKFLRLLVSTYL